MSDSPRREITTRPDGLTLVLFAILVLIGGANFVAVGVNVVELAPLWGAGLRFGVAGALFLLVMALRRLAFPRGSALVGTLVYGVLGFGVFYGLAYWALQFVPSAMAAIVVSAAPLITLLLAVAHSLERFQWRGALGALVAVAGITVMYSGSVGRGLTLGPMLALVGATICLAESSVVAKRYTASSPVVTNAIGMTTGALMLLALSALTGEAWVLPTATETWVSLIYLIVVGSLALFAVFLTVLRRWTASGSSYATVLFPVVTVLLAAWLRQEPITGAVVGGGLLVASGVWFGALAPRPVAESVTEA